MLRSIAAMAALVVCQAAGAAELPLNEVIEGSTNRGENGVYTFKADGPGALTVVVRATEGSDVAIVISDAAGQPLTGGRIDIDYQRDHGAEQGVVPIPREGEYQVVVEPLGSRADYVLAAAWLPFDALELPEDEDASPTSAIDLTLDEWVSDSLDNADGDLFDWFRVVADRDGELVVSTRGEAGDAILEAFADGQYADALQRSDQDIEGNNVRESITLDVTEGQTLYFKVSSYGNGLDYEIRATIIE